MVTEWWQNVDRMVTEWWQNGDRMVTEWENVERMVKSGRMVAERWQNDVITVTKWWQNGCKMVTEWPFPQFSHNGKWKILDILFLSGTSVQVVVLFYNRLLLSLPSFFIRGMVMVMVMVVFCFFQCTVAFDIRFNFTPEKRIENSYECWVHYKIKKHQRGGPL